MHLHDLVSKVCPCAGTLVLARLLLKLTFSIMHRYLSTLVDRYVETVVNHVDGRLCILVRALGTVNLLLLLKARISIGLVHP